MDQHRHDKRRILLEQGALNPRPESVRDPLFDQHSDFFDPQDLVLVKYEMLRRVRIDGLPVARAAEAFGFSRVTFYQALAAFEQRGLPGLLPQRRGPKQAHKLGEPVLQFIDRCRAREPHLRPADLAARIEHELGISVHPRSIERALSRRVKKGRSTGPR